MDQRSEATWQTDERPRARTVRVALAVLLAVAPLVALSACKESPPGITIDLEVDMEPYRPQFVKFHWMRPQRKPFEERLPEQGDFAATGANPFASLFVQTVGPLQQPRGLVIRGFRDGKEVSGAVLGIPPSSASQRRLRAVMLEPLPDEDHNGVPDVVDGNCFGDKGPAACQGQPIDQPGQDAGAPPDKDAGGLAETGAAPPPDADGMVTVIDGLVGFWRFDEAAGMKAVDSSGNHNDGTLRGDSLAWVAGRTGGALEIPNSGNHGVLVPPSPSIDAIRSFTIAAWLYRVDQRSGLANLLSRRSTGSSEYYALAISADGMARVYLNSQSSPQGLPLSSPAEIPLEAWTHLAATFDGTQVRLYVNGAEVAGTPTKTMIEGKDTSLCLGCGQNTDTMVTEPATGRLDDLRLYSRALNAAEIAAIAR